MSNANVSRSSWRSNTHTSNSSQACLGRLDSSIDVSVVIVNWNTRDLLDTCLRSLQGVGAVRIEIIVVDNGSRDGSADLVAREHPQARLTVNSRNVGFAAANNRGLAQAHGRYLLLLNSDTVVLPDAVAAMVCYMDAHPRVGALGPRLLNEDHTLQSSARDFPRLGRDALAILEVERWPLVGAVARRWDRRAALYRSDRSDHKQTRPVDWVIGACLVLRREALVQVGLLDEGYFFFAEEMDLCYRLRRQGWQTVFLADAEIVHIGGQSAGRVPAARLVWHYAGMLRFYCRWRSRAQIMALRGVIALAALAHIAWLLARHRGAAARPVLAAYAHVLARAVTP